VYDRASPEKILVETKTKIPQQRTSVARVFQYDLYARNIRVSYSIDQIVVARRSVRKRINCFVYKQQQRVNYDYEVGLQVADRPDKSRAKVERTPFLPKSNG